MSRQNVLTAGGLGIALGLSCAGAGWASEDPALTGSAAAANLEVLSVEAPLVVTPKFIPPAIAIALGIPQAGVDGVPAGEAETDKALGSIAGRGADTSEVAVAVTEQTLSAVNSGNTIAANSVISGSISLQDNALAGFNGLSNIIMNTGNNNNLQSNMSVTIVITP